VALGTLGGVLGHVNHILVALVLIQILALDVIVVLLLTREGELGRFVELLCVAFPWDVHHHQIFISVLSFVGRSLLRFNFISTCVNLRNVVLALDSVLVG